MWGCTTSFCEMPRSATMKMNSSSRPWPRNFMTLSALVCASSQSPASRPSICGREPLAWMRLSVMPSCSRKPPSRAAMSKLGSEKVFRRRVTVMQHVRSLWGSTRPCRRAGPSRQGRVEPHRDRTCCMTVTLRLNTFSEPSLLIAAREGGFLEQEGITLSLIQAKGSRPQIEGLLAGDWELAHTNADNVMKFRGQGREELFIFMVADLGISQKLVVHPHIREWQDLRGRTVGLDAPDSGYAFVVYELLDRHGLPWDSYQVKSLGATSYRLEGLRSGKCSRVSARILN